MTNYMIFYRVLYNGKMYWDSVSFLDGGPVRNIYLASVTPFAFISYSGAINHIHDVAMTDLLPIIKKWGYDDHLYVCFNEKLGLNMYKYAVKIVSDNPNCKWKNVNEARKSFGNDDAFDQLIWEDFTLTQNDARKSKTQNDIWKLFQNGFISVHGFLS